MQAFTDYSINIVCSDTVLERIGTILKKQLRVWNSKSEERWKFAKLTNAYFRKTLQIWRWRSQKRTRRRSKCAV